MMKLEYEHFSSWAGGVLPMKSGGRWLPKKERLSREGIISPRHPSADGYPKGGDIRLLTANIEYRISNKKHKSIYSRPAIAYSATARLHRVVSKPGINKPHDRIVRQQARILTDDLRSTATSEYPSERTNSNDKQNKLAAHSLWLAANSCLLPFGETERGLLLANIEYRITNKKHKSIYSRPAIAYSATARLHRVVSKLGINKPHDRIVRQQARILTDDLRSTETSEHPSERTNINDKQNKLAAHSLWLAAKNSNPIFLAKGERTVANIKNHHAYAT
ncbi:hypothetical protein [Maribellus luteus]|nr:hypothetical protein [Maribellus luteus]